jgi:hypothetical protein
MTAAMAAGVAAFEVPEAEAETPGAKREAEEWSQGASREP